MSKESSDRIDETIAFIAAHKEPQEIADAEHALIVKTLNDWKRLTAKNNRDKLSALMSQNDARQRAGNPTHRAFVRASTLIKCAITLPDSNWQKAASDDKCTPGPGAQSLYKSSLSSARDYIYSTPEQLNRLIAEIRINTLVFLQNNKLVINGGNKAGNPTNYTVAVSDGAYSFDCYGANAGRVSLPAINVMATKYANVRANPGAITAVDSASAPNCDLLFTTQFTGCTFCFMKSPDGQNIRAAHIDPERTSGFSGQDVRDDIAGRGGFANGNGGVFKAYGRVPDGSNSFGYPQSAEQMIIIGVKHANGWELYSQISLKGGNLRAQRIDG